jgi:2-polyprenyl-3-methyl-5-hydroxy-6-metoxy-1,4-benzoquinol methylase
MKQIFDRYVETSFDREDQAVFKFPQFDFNYRAYFPQDRDAAVLDIGIGRGEMLHCMKAWGYQEQGVDISPSTVAHCARLGLRCEVAGDTAAWLAARPGRYRLITCLDVLEHVPRDQAIGFVAAIRAALAGDGVAIIQVPNLQSPFGYLHHFNDFTHVNGFVEHSLAQVLLSAGFTRFEFHGFEESGRGGTKAFVRRRLRSLYRGAVHFLRRLNDNPDPRLLHPVLYAVVRK